MLEARERTQAGCEQLRVEIGQELLVLCIELAHSCDNIARQADADDLQDGLENEQCQVGKIRMRAVRLVVEDLHEAIIAVVVGLRRKSDKSG